MPQFNVCFDYEGRWATTIEAKDRDDAFDKAKRELDGEVDDATIMSFQVYDESGQIAPD